MTFTKVRKTKRFVFSLVGRRTHFKSVYLYPALMFVFEPADRFTCYTLNIYFLMYYIQFNFSILNKNNYYENIKRNSRKD